MSVHYQDDMVTLHHGDAATVASTLAPASVRAIVTSPPYYGLRDYGHEDQLGAEGTVDEYVAGLVALFSALRRVLTDDGTLWINLGDSYTSGNRPSYATDPKLPERKHLRPITPPGLKPKDLIGIPWRVAFALQADGWILRSDIIWAKPNPMPESVTDRPTKAHEYLFLLAKSPKYYYDSEAIAEASQQRALSSWDARRKTEPTRRGDPGISGQTNRTDSLASSEGRNKRTVWNVPTVPFSEAHFATYPPELIRPCILAGSERGDTVLDPFSGSGTTGMVATQEGRRYVGIDVNSDYLDLSLRTRFASPVLDMTGGAA